MDPDPWNWTVSDVQQFFRNDAARYMADMPHSRLPQLDPFLNALSENDVNGAILLTTIDAASLRDDCGVTKLGERGAVIHCITKLRKQSTTHLSRNDPFGLQTPPSLPLLALPPVPAAPEAVGSSKEHTVPVQHMEQGDDNNEHSRPGEVEVQDSHGRKRRKLDLTKIDAPQKRRRILLDLTASSSRPEYFGDLAFPIDDIFYDRTAFGQAIGDLQPIGNVIVSTPDRKLDLQKDNFQFFAQNATIGESSYVYSHVRHFLSSIKEINTRRRRRDAIGFVPYRGIPGLEKPSATVLQFSNEGNEAVAIRENAAYLSGGFELDEPTEQSPGENDYLLEKYKPTEEVLPLFGDADIDFDDDQSQTTVTADDAEQEAEEVEDDLDLSLERAGEVVEEFTNDCINKWKDDLPRLEQKRAWSIWKKTKQSRTIRDLLIRGAETKIEHLTKRLATMKTEMLSDTWQSEDKLRTACVVLEPTIEDREEQRWMIMVWRRREEPAHVVRHGTHTNKPSLQTLDPGEKDKGIIVHPHDRFSVSPARITEEAAGNDKDETIQHEAIKEVGNNLDEEIQYDADDEVFQTPEGSRANSPAPDSFAIDTPQGLEFESADLDNEEDSENKSNVDNPLVPSGSEVTERAKDANFHPSEEDSESELPDASTFVPLRKPNTPVKSSTQPVDLTGLTDSSQPPRKPGRPPKSSGKKNIAMDGDPTNATTSDVDSWDYAVLVKNQDRQRILIKLLTEKGSKFRNLLNERLHPPWRHDFENQLHAALQSRRNGTTDPSLKKETAQLMMQTAEMYIRYQIPRVIEQGTRTLDKQSWHSILQRSQYTLFAGLLGAILVKRESKLFITPKSSSAKLGSSSAPIHVSSSDNGEAARQPLTPTKTRKRRVKRSEAAFDSRKMALNRQRRYEESQITNSTQLVAMIASDPSHSSIEINPAKTAQDKSIYVSDRIARQMKAHQIDGARFLWREITAEGGEDGQGCILAHTMGLGKTMQTIALLAAVNEAAMSEEPGVYKQLPAHLQSRPRREERQVRVLILSPPGLLQNWRREIDKWAPTQLGNIITLDRTNKRGHIGLLREWMRVGGALLMGYQMFRSTLDPNPDKKNAKLPHELAEFEKILLKGPELVVADEAQEIKNEDSGIAMTASRILTESRIALTGTPMSNDVKEIYALVSWVAPGFLGDQQEFNAHFAVPIGKGLYADSSPYERRNSTKKLKVLHAEIEPKIHRANIEVLRGSLKSKIEYVITVPLRSAQEEIYRKYIKTLRSSDKAEKASQMTLFAWLGDLALLTNHPHCLRQKLLAPPARKSSKHKQEGNGLDATSREHTPSTSTESGSITPLYPGLLTETDQFAEDGAAAEGLEDGEGPSLDDIESRQILDEIEDDMDPELSAKVAIFLKLLNFSFDCKDKVLVFSGSIPTIDYLGELLERSGKRFGRIDGCTAMNRRDDILDQFHNEKREDKFDIMLVSTKAGGVGLNIPGANRVFIFDFRFNPTVEEQAIGRAYRLGQKKNVFVYRFVTGGTFEMNIYNTQLYKSSLSARVVDKKNPRRNAERDAREYLYEPKFVPQEDLTGRATGDPLVLGRLLEQHGAAEDGKIDTMIRAIQTMETLQEEVQDAPLNDEEQKEVNEMIEQNRKRPRGKRVAMGPPYAKSGYRAAPTGEPSVPSASAPFPTPPSRIVAFQMPRGALQQPPPTSTASTNLNSSTPSHPMGGLPITRE